MPRNRTIDLLAYALNSNWVGVALTDDMRSRVDGIRRDADVHSAAAIGSEVGNGSALARGLKADDRLHMAVLSGNFSSVVDLTRDGRVDPFVKISTEYGVVTASELAGHKVFSLMRRWEDAGAAVRPGIGSMIGLFSDMEQHIRNYERRYTLASSNDMARRMQPARLV